MRALDVASSLAVSVARLGAGMRASLKTERTPEKLLEVYDFEACPYCRQLREALSELDLDAIIYPCPRGGTRFRPIVKAKTGRSKFPFLVDPNDHGQGPTEMHESVDIVRYLATTYGDGRIPLSVRFRPLTTTSSFVSSAFRITKGRAARPSKPAPEKLLELWSFEASPYCRLVREALTSLEIPYILHNVAKGSRNRAAFRERSGKMMVPYLVDPNDHGQGPREMFESADIVRYLEETYGA